MGTRQRSPLRSPQGLVGAGSLIRQSRASVCGMDVGIRAQGSGSNGARYGDFIGRLSPTALNLTTPSLRLSPANSPVRFVESGLGIQERSARA